MGLFLRIMLISAHGVSDHHYCTCVGQSERTRVKQGFIHNDTVSSFSCDEGQLCDMQKAPCTEGVNLLQ